VRVYERWNRVRHMGSPQGNLYRTALNLHRSRVGVKNSDRPRDLRLRPNSPRARWGANRSSDSPPGTPARHPQRIRSESHALNSAPRDGSA
jgi:hypothetical protein